MSECESTWMSHPCRLDAGHRGDHADGGTTWGRSWDDFLDYEIAPESVVRALKNPENPGTMAQYVQERDT